MATGQLKKVEITFINIPQSSCRKIFDQKVWNSAGNIPGIGSLIKTCYHEKRFFLIYDFSIQDK